MVAWAAVIFAFSAVPGSHVPGRIGPLAHVLEYAALGALLYSALRLDTTRKRALVLAVIIASCYAVTDEFHQAFVPMRVPDPVDWALDTAGAIAGALAVASLERTTTKCGAQPD